MSQQTRIPCHGLGAEGLHSLPLIPHVVTIDKMMALFLFCFALQVHRHLSLSKRKRESRNKILGWTCYYGYRSGVFCLFFFFKFEDVSILGLKSVHRCIPWNHEVGLYYSKHPHSSWMLLREPFCVIIFSPQPTSLLIYGEDFPFSPEMDQPDATTWLRKKKLDMWNITDHG